nr:PREDICTED: coiled-coil domain-containing protein 65 [Bemisia tabaci]
MGPKKKGKGNKLARMSEEERIRYLQHRAAIEEEARRRKEQLVATYLKNKLKREEAFSRLNNAKINQQWRHVLRQIKNKDLKDDMKTLWSTFETAIKCKNKIIETLLLDLDGAEAQYMLSFKTHSEMIKKLIDMHESRLHDIHENYESQKSAILDEAYKEQKHIQAVANHDLELLGTVKYFTEVNSAEKLQESEKAATEQEDELRNTMQCRIEKMEGAQIKTLEALAKECQKVLRNYSAVIEPITVHYNALKIKDGMSSLDRIENMRCLHKYMETISRLKKQIQDMKMSHKANLENIKTEQSDLTSKFQRLRKQMKLLNDDHAAGIRHLSVVSSSVIAELKVLLEKGRQMQQISENCQKLTTTREKLLPIITKIQIADCENQHPLNACDEKMPEPYNKLLSFWQKFNESKLECEFLKMKYTVCSQENKELREMLQNYMGARPSTSAIPTTKPLNCLIRSQT